MKMLSGKLMCLTISSFTRYV